MHASSWLAEAAAIVANDWRRELRTRSGLATLLLFALTTLILVSLAWGPLALVGPGRDRTLPALLWIILLFAAASGLPRAFVSEEELGTAALLRLSALPSAVFAGKAAYCCSLLVVLELVTVPAFLGLTALTVERPGLLLLALAAGGLGIAVASTLIGAMIAQATGRGLLFAVLAFPILLPPLVLAVELTRIAIGGGGAHPALTGLLLYDGTVLVAGLMLFPAVWNP